jgi:hypothetical protein
MFDIEFLDIPPLSSAGGTVRLPGSKSISNRVLLLAALSHGDTTVHDLLASDDTAVMLAALRQRWAAASSRTATPPSSAGWAAGPFSPRPNSSWATPARPCGR